MHNDYWLNGYTQVTIEMHVHIVYMCVYVHTC